MVSMHCIILRFSWTSGYACNYSSCRVQNLSYLLFIFSARWKHFDFDQKALINSSFYTKKDWRYGRVCSASNARWPRGLSLSTVPAYGRFMPGLRTPARMKRPGMTLCMPRGRWTRIKAVMLGYFLHRLFPTVGGQVFTRVWGCLGLPSPIHGITLRLAPWEEQNWVELRITGVFSENISSVWRISAGDFFLPKTVCVLILKMSKCVYCLCSTGRLKKNQDSRFILSGHIKSYHYSHLHCDMPITANPKVK